MHQIDTIVSLGQQRRIAEYIMPVQDPGMHSKVK